MSKRNNPGCNCCGVPCEHCDTGMAPESYLLTTSGWADGTCDECADLDGDYVLVAYDNPYTDACTWRWNNPNYPSGGGPCNKLLYIELFIDADGVGGGADEVLVRFFFEGSVNHTFSVSVSVPIDCFFEDLEVPYASRSDYECDSTGATCTLTAL